MSLLCLVVAAIAAIEALAGFTVDAERQKIVWWSNSAAWLMVVLFIAALAMYFRVRAIRKRKMQERV
jgi:flagellar biosynthesis/type III secretory pathway M-ring protein FliF/YscJ